METESIEGEEVMTEAEKDALIRELADLLMKCAENLRYEDLKRARAALAKVPK